MEAAPPLGPIAPWVFLILLLPRVVRLVYPAVWVEDDVLLQGALGVARGLRPYVDFAHAQMPLLEWVGGLYILVAGPSHRAMEILNGAAIYGTTLLVLMVGRRAAGSKAGIAAAMLYACHSLVFRYHVWAREFFVTALVLGAAVLVLSEERPSRRRIALIAVLSVTACAIKLTAALSILGIALFLFFGRRQPVRAGALLALTATGVLLVSAVCYWRYGEAFLFQAFLFHFLKGQDSVGGGPLYVTTLLDVLGPLLALGLVRHASRRSWNDALGLTIAVLASTAMFYGLLSPTAWGHNFLEMWPYVAILAGSGVVWLLDAFRTSWWRLGAGLAAVTASLIWLTPIRNESTLRGSTYGFGFVPRSELASLAAGLRLATNDQEEVIAPSFIAFEAGRVQAIRYPENYGVMRAGREMFDAVGFAKTREAFVGKSFFDLINETSHHWNDRVIESIAVGGPVNAVIPDGDIQLLPLVGASPAALTDRGFRLTLQTEHFALWVRPPQH